jgi:hypothetical protein
VLERLRDLVLEMVRDEESVLESVVLKVIERVFNCVRDGRA